jgi:DNA-binding CsgD family transcriptional regulator
MSTREQARLIAQGGAGRDEDEKPQRPRPRRAAGLRLLGVPRDRTATPAASAPEDSHGLTRREIEILRYVAEGNSNAEVARTLSVTEQMVEFHLSNVFCKLGVSNRVEASRWAQLNGVLPAPSQPG